MRQTVAKNAVFFTSALVGQKIFSFIFFTLIARFFGVENTGAYIFALSYTSIFSIFGDLGLAPLLIRETARSPQESERILRAMLAAKTWLIALTVAAAILVLQLINKSYLINTMVYLAVGIMVLDSFTLSFWAVFRGRQNLKYESINVLITQILILAVGLVVIWAGLPVPFLVGAVLAGSAYQFIASGILTGQKFRLKTWPKFDQLLIRHLFKASFPFALAGIFTRFYSYLDQILLSLMVGEKALGFYSVPYKLTFALQFIPQAFGAALFPAMSDYYIHSKDKLARLFERAIFYLTALAMPSAVGIALLARPIILKIYGSQYQPSILALQIMMIGLIFVFLNFPVGALLNAANRQTQQTINLGITLISNALLNIILIPRFSYLGASAAIVLSMAILFLTGLYRVGQVLDYRMGFLLISFLKASVAAGLMGLAVWYGLAIYQPGGKLELVYQLLVIPLLGAFLYFLVMFLLKGFRKDDVIEIIRAVLRRS